MTSRSAIVERSPHLLESALGGSAPAQAGGSKAALSLRNDKQPARDVNGGAPAPMQVCHRKRSAILLVLLLTKAQGWPE
jgi:hypothetical protein